MFLKFFVPSPHLKNNKTNPLVKKEEDSSLNRAQ